VSFIQGLAFAKDAAKDIIRKGEIRTLNESCESTMSEIPWDGVFAVTGVIVGFGLTEIVSCRRGRKRRKMISCEKRYRRYAFALPETD
jgi:hypothetical protein